MKSGGTFLATFLPAPAKHPIDQPIKRMNITLYGHRDPFHYGFEDFEHVVRGLPWTVQNLGPWDHPANTEMLEFKKIRRDPAQTNLCILMGNFTVIPVVMDPLQAR